MKTNLIYIKTLKTYSESTAKSLEDFSNDNDLLYTRLPFFLIDKINEKFNVSAGHIPYQKKYLDVLNKYVDKEYNIFWLTTLREPLQRAISQYYSAYYIHYKIPFNLFYKREGHKSKARSNNIVNDPLNNSMSWYAGFDKIDDINEKSIKERFDFIIISEQYKKSLNILSKMLDYNFKEYTLNITKRDGDKNVTDDVLRKFKENNKLDYKLYNFAKKIYLNEDSISQ